MVYDMNHECVDFCSEMLFSDENLDDERQTFNKSLNEERTVLMGNYGLSTTRFLFLQPSFSIFKRILKSLL